MKWEQALPDKIGSKMLARHRIITVAAIHLSEAMFLGTGCAQKERILALQQTSGLGLSAHDTDSQVNPDTMHAEDNSGQQDTNSSHASGDTDEDGDENSGNLSYYANTKRIIEDRCVGCHRSGEIAPFPLTNYKEVYALRAAIELSVESGSMPPWPAARGCREYIEDFSLSDEERETLLSWIAEGAQEGNPDDYIPPGDETEDIKWDMVLEMEEPYTPRQEPDDYRCFLVEWPGDVPRYMTAFEIRPGEPEMAHHLLAYQIDPADADRYRQADADEPGPGYTCYGGPSPNGSFSGSNLFGTWVPGQGPIRTPEGTGILFKPGSLLVFQMHYNTLTAEPRSDQSKFAFHFEDKVERPATAALFMNYLWVAGGMPIPAGHPDVKHEYTVPVAASIGSLGADIGGGPLDAYSIHLVGPHLHQFGKSVRVSIDRAGGGSECLVEIPKWDFWWQIAYGLKNEVVVNPLDALRLECHFDNSQENQPFIDGAQMKPRDINWGDGSLDEMCLVGLFVTKAPSSAG